MAFDLAETPLRHIGLALAIVTGTGPEAVTVFDSRHDGRFKAS